MLGKHRSAARGLAELGVLDRSVPFSGGARMNPNRGARGCCLYRAVLVLHFCATSWHQDCRHGGLPLCQGLPEGAVGFAAVFWDLIVLEDMQLLVGMLPSHTLPTSLARTHGTCRRSGGKDPAIPLPSWAAPSATRLLAESPPTSGSAWLGETAAPQLLPALT